MAPIFIDNAHFVAVIHHQDALHELSLRVEAELQRRRPQPTFVTTELVLTECLAAFSRMGAHLRRAAVQYVRGVFQLPHFQVVSPTHDLFARGLDLYEARADQRYSLTDCVSMLVCRDLGIAEVLTSDGDFEHEGFRILLKDG